MKPLIIKLAAFIILLCGGCTHETAGSEIRRAISACSNNGGLAAYSTMSKAFNGLAECEDGTRFLIKEKSHIIINPRRHR